MRSFRCAGCQNRYPFPPFSQVGLKSVCSADCSTVVRRRASGTPARARAQKDDVPTEVRGKVVVRDSGRCRYCGKPSLMLHHIRYRSQGGSHTEGNLIVLCQEHHELVHSDKSRWMGVLQEVVRLLESGQSVTVPEVVRRWPSSS